MNCVVLRRLTKASDLSSSTFFLAEAERRTVDSGSVGTQSCRLTCLMMCSIVLAGTRSIPERTCAANDVPMQLPTGGNIARSSFCLSYVSEEIFMYPLHNNTCACNPVPTPRPLPKKDFTSRPGLHFERPPPGLASTSFSSGIRDESNPAQSIESRSGGSNA